MKSYTLSGAASYEHTPEHPDRTARRQHLGLDFDVTFQVWPSRGAMARTVRMQQKRPWKATDWKPCVRLTEGEGH